MSDLQRLLQRLDETGIEFVLVGGYAAMLHTGGCRCTTNRAFRALRYKLKKPGID